MSVSGAAADRDLNMQLLNKKLSYRRGTARCVVSVEILPIATTSPEQIEVMKLEGRCVINMCTQP